MRFTVQRPALVDNENASPSSSAYTTVDMAGCSLPSCSGSLADCRTGVGPLLSTEEQRNLLTTMTPSVDEEHCQSHDSGAVDRENDSDDDRQLSEQVRGVKEEAGGGDKTVRDRRVLETLVDRGRRFAARQTRRIVHKDGTCNIASLNVTERRRRYLVDIFTTLVDMRWRYNVALFGAAFIVSWTTFAVVWFSIAYTHGDCHRANDDDWQPCITNVHDFSTALLFSIETQTTIGYGSVHNILWRLPRASILHC